MLLGFKPHEWLLYLAVHDWKEGPGVIKKIEIRMSNHTSFLIKILEENLQL